MVPLLSGTVYRVAVVQLLVLISVGSWWYFLPGTRAEGGTGWALLPVLAHPTCTHWPRPTLHCSHRKCSAGGSSSCPPYVACVFSLLLAHEIRDSCLMLTVGSLGADQCVITLIFCGLMGYFTGQYPKIWGGARRWTWTHRRAGNWFSAGLQAASVITGLGFLEDFCWYLSSKHP